MTPLPGPLSWARYVHPHTAHRRCVSSASALVRGFLFQRRGPLHGFVAARVGVGGSESPVARNQSSRYQDKRGGSPRWFASSRHVDGPGEPATGFTNRGAGRSDSNIDNAAGNAADTGSGAVTSESDDAVIIATATATDTTSVSVTDDAAMRKAVYGDQDDTWVDRRLPTWLRPAVPYLKLARVDRSVGTWLLLWPSCWSILLAAPASLPHSLGGAVGSVGSLPEVQMMALFGVGAFVMRGAGCTINDLWDRDFDAQVERTKGRPLASGAITPLAATVFLGGQLTAGLGVLTQLNMQSIALGAASVPLVVGYPLAKRFTNWPQLVLGCTFNWGALLGWSAVHGGGLTAGGSLAGNLAGGLVSSPPHLALHLGELGALASMGGLAVVLPLYAGSVCWTLVYDTLYAHQDKHDDQAVGLKSTALTFGDNTKAWLAVFSGGAVLGWTAAGTAVGLAWPFYAGMAVCGGHLAWQVTSADLEDRQNLNKRFVSNSTLGGLVFASILAGQLAI